MISIVKIMEGESNVDKFTYKQRDAGGVRPSYQNTKLVKQGSAGDYVKYNVMVMGKFGGTIYYNKNDKSIIASGGESNKKRNKSKNKRINIGYFSKSSVLLN